MTGPAPITQSRAARQGKIRWAIRGPKGFPVTLDTFRFTSPDRVAIEALAELYGGEVKDWDEPSAAERNQFEVISETNDINVWLVPGQMYKGYEYWQGGVCERRCDGETVTVTESNPNGSELVEQPCMCDAAGEMTCKPKVRFSVIIPEIPFGGVWQIDTSSWAAWHSIPDLAEMLSFMQGDKEQIEPARILLTDRSKKVFEKGRKMTKRFKVIQVILPRSPMEIMSGTSGLASLASPVQEAPVTLDPAQSAPQLTTGASPIESEASVIDISSGQEVVDAEIVQEIEQWRTKADAIRAGIPNAELVKRDKVWVRSDAE